MIVCCLQSHTIFSQSCNCSFSGSATWTVSGNSNTNYTVGTNQKLLITNAGNYTGTITMNGGTVYNLGTITPSSSSSYSSGTIRNCGTINWNTTPFSGEYANSIYIYNCESGKINMGNGAHLYIQYILKNYGTITIPDGNFGVYQYFYNYSTGKIKQSGSTKYFEIYGGFSNAGTIEALGGGGFSHYGNPGTNTGFIKIDKDYFNSGYFYTECNVQVGKNFKNCGYIYGPIDLGKWGQFTVVGQTENYGYFNIKDASNRSGYLDLCDNGHPGGGWDYTYTYYDMYVGYTTTYCQHTGSGCTNVSPYEVTITPSAPSACTGGCVTLTATVVGGSGSYTYTWGNGLGSSNTINVCPTVATVYSISVTDNANAAVATATINIPVNTLPTVSISATAGTICPGATKTLTASGANTYVWSPAGSLSATTGTSVVATPTVTTTYTVVGTNTTTGCSKEATYVVSTHPAPLANAGDDKYACPGQAAQLGGAPTASGGTSPFSYSWSPTTNLTGATTANPTANPTTIREYSVTVTDSRSCTAKDETVVTYYNTCCDIGIPALSLQSYLNKIINKGPILNNDCIVLNPPTDKAAWYAFVGDPIGGATPVNSSICDITYLGGNNYNYTTIWKSAHTNTSGNEYECTIKLSHLSSCNSPSSIKFLHSIAPHPTKNTGGGNIYAFVINARLSNGTDVELEGESSCKQITLDCACDKLKPGFVAKSNCKGVAVQFNNTSKGTLAGTTYAWKFGNGSTSTLQNPSYTYTTVGNYTVELTVNNVGGCSKTVNHVVTIKDCSNCQGGEQMLAFQEYLNTIASHQTLSSSSCIKLLPPSDRQIWCNFIGDAVCDVAPPYIFHETTCESQMVNQQTLLSNKWKTVHINSNNIRYECTISLKHVPIYGNTSVSFFHSIAPDAGQNNIHAFTMKARLANALDVDVSGEVSCKIIACCDGSGITAGDDVQICKGDSAALAASGGSTYSWLPVTGLSNPNIANPFAKPSSTTIYTVTIKKANCNLSFTDNVTVEVLNKTLVSAGADKTICDGDVTTLSATGGGAYEWQPTDGLSNANVANPGAWPAVTTTYTVTVNGTDICPVKNTDEVTVFVNPKPTITTSGNKVSCNKDSVQLTANAPGAISYSWLPVDGLSKAGISNPKASPLSTTTYTVTVRGANNCINTAKVTVTVGESEGGSVSPTQIICLGDSVQLSAYGGLNYSWSPDKDLSCGACANPMAKPSITTIYEVSITTLSKCISKKTVTVIVNPELNLEVSPDVSVCVGAAVNLQATGAKEYHWEPAGDLSCEYCPSPVLLTASKTTTYTVTAFNGGCTDRDSVTVTVDPAQNADFITRPINCSVLFVAVPKDMIKYEWDMGDGTHKEGWTFEHIYEKSGMYKVILTVTGSCGTVEIEKVVTISNCNDECN